MREEIEYGGRNYFLQTGFLPKKKCIQSSFFANGALFDTQIRRIEGKPSPDDLKTLTKEFHLHNKSKFQFILGVREKAKTSDNPLTHLKLAQALFRRNLYAESIREAELAIEKGNTDSLPYIVIGSAFYRVGEYDEAFGAVQKGVDINPEYPDLHNLMGLIYLKQQRCRDAIESLKRAIGLNIYYSEPYLNLAKAYVLNSIVKEDYELSKDMDAKFSSNMERACQLNPFIQGDVLEEAKRLFDEKKYEETIELLDGLEERSKGNGIEDILLELYLVFLRDGDSLSEDVLDEYLKRIGEIIDQNPNFADGYNSLGILYTAKCKIFMDMASASFKKALEINNHYRKARKNLRLAENDRQGIFILLKALLD